MSWFVLMSTIGALWAAVWNSLAAHRAIVPAWRRMYAITAGFSTLYVLAWGSLLLAPGIDRGEWSAAVTPISMASFFIVWSGDAVISFFHNSNLKEGATE